MSEDEKEFKYGSTELSGILVIREGVTSIWHDAFNGGEEFADRNGLTGIYLPSTLTSIGELAFHYWWQVVKIQSSGMM